VVWCYKKINKIKFQLLIIMKQHLLEYWKKTKLITDKRVLAAFERIDREDFVLDEYKKQAYEDVPLPIKADQTISQPTTIMIMTQALELKKGDKVLEIGAGSGYQAALIAEIVKPAKVYTIEYLSELALFARQNLENVGIKNVKVICTDGSKGYDKESPYDKIIVTAACPKVPKPLLEQLKKGGILVAPVGSLYGQKMLKLKKNDEIKVEDLGDFIFVKLKGEYGWK